MSVSINGTGGITFADASTQSTGGYTGFRNRIINGAMMIDQRNAGASVTPTNGQYTVDRFRCAVSQASKLTAQQSSTAPSGFVNSLLITSSSAYSVLANDFFDVRQPIEGLNIADFAWGTASAATVTLSFWVRSSLTGTFGGALKNNSSDRSYPFTYTISSANTWEQKSVTIPGDTTGTWLTTNAIGVQVQFGLGSGSTYSGTSGSWASGNYNTATGATSVVGTNGATFYITGVQLEKGSVATPFEFRQYGTELALCQRYLPAVRCGGTGNEPIGIGIAYSSTAFWVAINLPVTPRVPPTGATVSSQTNFIVLNGSLTNLQTTGLAYSSGSNNQGVVTGTVASGLTAGQACPLMFRGASATTSDYIYFNGSEL